VETISLKVGDQVYRKSDFGKCRNFYGHTGTIERLIALRNGKSRAYVRWHRSMRLWGGTVDGHSTIAVSQLVPVTPERTARLDEIQTEIREEYRRRSEERERQWEEQFRDLQPGGYWHIRCPKLRPDVVSPAHLVEIDAKTGLHLFRCDSHLCQETHLVSGPDGAVLEAQR
jgi:hypothetical protein